MSWGTKLSDKTKRIIAERWAQGVPAARIGAELGITKNSVVGYVRRAGLPARPSLIVRDGNAPVRKPAPVRLDVGDKELVPIERARALAAVPAVVFRPRECCWPLGEPRTPEFRFCGAPAFDGKSYCDEHQKMSVQTVVYERRSAYGN